MAKHNHIAVWLLIVFQQLLGFIWYSKAMFMDAWIAGQTRTMDQMDKADATPFIYMILGSIFSCYIISWIVQATQTNNIKNAFLLSLMLCLGFVFPSLAVHYKFLGISVGVMGIDLGMTCVSVIITTCVLAVWKKK